MFKSKEFEKALLQHGYTMSLDQYGDKRFVKMNETGEWEQNIITRKGSDIFEVKISYHPAFDMISRRRNDEFAVENGVLYVSGTYGGTYKA